MERLSLRYEKLAAIVFDLAGTTVDYGSCAPAGVFQEVFRRQHVNITARQAREPMGKAKRDHIMSILQMPEVAAAWEQQHAAAPSEQDIDALYDAFLPLQKETLAQHSDVIDGVPAVVEQCRQRGLRIAATTGYTRELLDIVLAGAKLQGFEPEFALGAEDTLRGRPAPFMLFEIAQRLDIFPMSKFVKVDDTPVGIQAGRNAGCWTVGITRTGNSIGLKPEEWAALSETEQGELLSAAEGELTRAGADTVIESVADILPVLDAFETRLMAGELPQVGATS